jgi:hypothetical protein
VGVVLPNCKGKAIAGMHCPLQNVLDSEAIELLTGLELLEQIGCSRVIIELDSLKLINACNGTIEIWTPWSAILADCLLKASSMIEVSPALSKGC